MRGNKEEYKKEGGRLMEAMKGMKVENIHKFCLFKKGTSPCSARAEDLQCVGVDLMSALMS